MTQKRNSSRRRHHKKIKDLSNPSETVRFKEGEGTHFVSSYSITYEAIANSANHYPKKLNNQMSELHSLIQNEPKEAIPKLLKLKEKYPNIPMIYNYLAMAYSQIKDYSAMEMMCVENYTKNPDYLFAKINYAEMCLGKEDYGKIAEIFDNKFDLKLLYPDRNEFHISEFEGFTGIACIYFHKIGKESPAKVLYDSLKKISPDSAIFRRVNRILYPNLMTKLMRKLLTKKTDHKIDA